MYPLAATSSDKDYPCCFFSRVQKDELERRQKNPTYKTFIKKAIRMKKCDFLMVCVSLLIKILYFFFYIFMLEPCT